MIWILGIVILTGVAVVVVLVALVGVFRLPVRTAFGEVMPARDLTRPAITAAVVGFVLASIGLTLFRSYHPIPAGEVGVVSEFGKIVGQEGEGPQFIAPWRDLRRVDIKVQRAEFSDMSRGAGLCGGGLAGDAEHLLQRHAQLAGQPGGSAGADAQRGRGLL